MPDQKSQVERLLDVAVYAPLGFLLTRDQAIADMATAGRKQIAFSRSLGRAALKGLSRGVQPSPASASPTPAKAPSEPEAVANSKVDGYSAMTAKQVIARVATCTPAEASWIRAEETAGKNRVTVLRALDARE